MILRLAGNLASRGACETFATVTELTAVAINPTIGAMGDKSPKAAQKQAAQKQAKQKKNSAAAAKQAPKPKK